MRLLFFFLFLGLWLSHWPVPSAYSMEEKKETKSRQDQAIELVDSAHKGVSDTILLLSNRIDSFFGSRRGDDEANGSRLRVFYDSTFRQNQKWDKRADLRFSLRLPQLQKLLKLSFKKEGGKGPKKPAPDPDDDTGNNEEVVDPNEQASRVGMPQGATSGAPSLRDLLLDRGRWVFNFNTGLRVDIPPNVFARARLRRTMVLFNSWEFNPTQEATWFSEQGFGLNFSHDLDYQLADNLLFRIVNSAFWVDETDVVSTTHGPILFQQLTNHRALSYSLQAQGTNRPKFFINNYSASIQYRQLIHSNWLFLEARPAIDFPKDQAWNEVYSFFFRVEAVFGSI
jgi:hypothetical protein